MCSHSPDTSPRPSSPLKTVALVGNPNCGKTTLFNLLSGLRYKVANYPGVTVDKKEASVELGSLDVKLIDLPGTYSVHGLSLDELVVTKALSGKLLTDGKPDLVLIVVDASNLERNLFIVSEVIDAGHNVVVALNMIDECAKRGIKVFDELLSRSLDVPVVPIVAKRGTGIEGLKAVLQARILEPRASSKRLAWLPENHALRRGDLCAFTSLEADPALMESSTIRATTALRYQWINASVRACSSQAEHRKSGVAEKIDAVISHRIFGFVVMAGIFALIFQSIFLWASVPMDLISSAVDGTSGLLKRSLPQGPLTSLLADGIVAGVGNVLVFVPQIAILFFFLAILEDCGYLSRAAFLLDNFMRRVGLQGRSFIPLLSSFACAVPGILSTRTIPSRSDRLATIMVAPLMSCSARLPVYTVLIGAFIPAVTIAGFSAQGLTLLALYLLGIVGACVVSLFMKGFVLEKESSFYVMELPPLRAPTAPVVLRTVYDNVLSFLKNASTIILSCSIIVWFLAAYPKPPAEFNGNPVEFSYAGRMGKALEPVIRPLGYNWEMGVAIIASFPAREVFVSSLSTIYNLGDDTEGNEGLVDLLKKKKVSGEFTLATGLSLLVFYVFACQCMSTLAVARRETGSWWWTISMFVYMTVLAYAGAYVTFRLATNLSS